MGSNRYIWLITAPVLATSVLLLGMGGAAAIYVHQMNKELSEQLAANLSCTLASEDLVIGVRDARLKLLTFVETGDRSELAGMEQIRANTLQNLNAVEQAATTDDLRKLITKTRSMHTQFFADYDRLLATSSENELRLAMRQFIRQITMEVLVPAEQLLDLSQSSAADRSMRSLSLADTVGMGLLLLGACGAAAGLLAGYGIARGVARRIAQSEHEATRAEQLAAVGQLAAGLAHELRNPLTAMRMLMEAGRQQPDGPLLEGRDLDVLDEETARLEKLVESFLDFARPPHLETYQVDARDLVTQTMHLVSGPARQCGVTLQHENIEEPMPIVADPVQIRQVLLNLLLNAIDAVGDGGNVFVRLRPRIVSTEGERWGEILVDDDGPGIAMEQRTRIFEPFVSTKETGMGLGLAVSRRIVEAHGGSIQVEESSLGGARFRIRLPSVARVPAVSVG